MPGNINKRIVKDLTPTGSMLQRIKNQNADCADDGSIARIF
jgi:hypothetical protein